jgi:hypothetical protein
MSQNPDDAVVELADPMPAYADVGEFADTEVSLDEPEPITTYFPNVGEWVEHYLIPHWRRPRHIGKWDERWWEYAEVLSRFEALWRAWEALRLEGMTGMAIFFRDYLDPTMAVITDPNGPFWKVSDAHDRELPELWPTAPVPAGLFDPPTNQEG